MNDIIIKLIKGEGIDDEDIANELSEICDRVHSNSCDSDCPIYEHVLSEDDKNVSGCAYYRNGNMMLTALNLLLGLKIEQASIPYYMKIYQNRQTNDKTCLMER